MTTRAALACLVLTAGPVPGAGVLAPSGAAAQSGVFQVDGRLAEAVDWYTGVAGRVDDARARTLLLDAARDGDVLARMWVARCLSRGRMGFGRDEARARTVADSVLTDVRALADRGVTEAVFLMGTAHDEGLGVPEHANEAARWYRRAADAGHVLASHNLGNAYRSGRGVPPSDSAAVHWWRLAAEAGDAITQLRLGESYEAGRGVTRDLDAARRWYAEAVRRGNQQAREALARINN